MRPIANPYPEWTSGRPTLWPTIPGKAATLAICFTPGRNPPTLKNSDQFLILSLPVRACRNCAVPPASTFPREHSHKSDPTKKHFKGETHKVNNTSTFIFGWNPFLILQQWSFIFSRYSCSSSYVLTTIFEERFCKKQKHCFHFLIVYLDKKSLVNFASLTRTIKAGVPPLSRKPFLETASLSVVSWFTWCKIKVLLYLQYSISSRSVESDWDWDIIVTLTSSSALFSK